jgi:hypothetical protein
VTTTERDPHRAATKTRLRDRLKAAGSGLRQWNRQREAGGGIRAATAAKTAAFIVVGALLANAYVLPPSQRRGTTLPVFVEGFSSVLVGPSGTSGGSGTVDVQAQVNATETAWAVQPPNSVAFVNGAAVVTPEGDVPRTAIAKAGVLLSQVETRFVVPAAYAGLALRFADRGDFFAVVADPNPLYLRLVRVRSGVVSTLDRYFVNGGLLNARVRVELIDGIRTFVNGAELGSYRTAELAEYNGVGGLVALQPTSAGATFDDVMMSADAANIASAAASVGQGNNALASLAGLSEEEREAMAEAFKGLTPEQRQQLDSLSPEQIQQLKELAGK